MNILVFSWRDLKHPLAGGAEQVMHEHMKMWVKSGHQVVHFSSKLKQLKSEEEIDGVKLLRRGNQYFLGVQILGFIYYLSNKNKYDLIIDEFHGIPFFTPLYIKKPKLAVIQETAREVWFLNPFRWPFNYLIGILGYIVEPFIFLLYKKVDFITGSETAKNDVIKMGIDREKITIVPHGVLIKEPPKKIKKEKIPTLLYLGILSKDKGIEDALKCFKLLSSENFQFWVIGRYETKDYEKKLFRKIKEMKLNKRVKFWGYVSNEKKFELLKRAHILINPSIREGWGLVNIEANRMSTPVIAYNSPGLIDSVQNGISGQIVDNDPKSMALAVKQLLLDQSNYHKLSKGAKRWSNNFNWNISAKKSLDILNKLVK